MEAYGIDLALETPLTATSSAWLLGRSRVEGSGTDLALFLGEFEVQTSFMKKAFGILDTVVLKDADYDIEHANVFVDPTHVYVAVYQTSAYYLRFFKYDKAAHTLKYIYLDATSFVREGSRLLVTSTHFLHVFSAKTTSSHMWVNSMDLATLMSRDNVALQREAA